MRRHFGQLLCYLVPGLWLSGQFLLPSPSLFFPCFVPLARNLETLSTEANFYFCFVLCLQQRLKMDIGALASLKETFEDPTNGFPAKLAHPRNGRKHSFGRIHFAGKAVVFLAAAFGGVVKCRLFSQVLFVLNRSLFFQKSENLLLVKISKHFTLEKIWKLACLSHVLSTTSYGLLRPPSSKDSVQPGEVEETPKSKRKRCFFLNNFRFSKN